MPRRPRGSRLGGSRGVPVLVPVRASRSLVGAHHRPPRTGHEPHPHSSPGCERGTRSDRAMRASHDVSEHRPNTILEKLEGRATKAASFSFLDAVDDIPRRI